MTRLLSSNLLKRSYTSLQTEDKRVIDTNALMAQRIQTLAARMQESEQQGGFVTGIQAQVVEELTASDDAELLTADLGGETVDTQALVAQAMEQADLVVQEANRQAERILEDARSQAEIERKHIAEDARSQGYEQGKQAAAQELEREMQRLRDKERQLEAQYQDLVAGIEPRMVDVISGIYEHIFQVELSSHKEIVSGLIMGALSRIEGGRDFLVHVSREDYPYVSMQKKQIVAAVTAPGSTVELVEDMTLSANQCMIETDSGIYDCGLGTQLEELRQKLMLLSYHK